MPNKTQRAAQRHRYDLKYKARKNTGDEEE